MKQFSILFFVIGVFILLYTSGCDLKGPADATSVGQSGGNDLIITEVFTISPDKYYAYSWIEVYNPTRKNIPLFQEVKPATGYALGDNGTILVTNTTGGTWSDTVGDASYGNLNSIFFPQADVAYAVGENATILKIDTNVAVRQSPPAGVTVSLNAVSGVLGDIQARTAIAVGDGGTILRTINKGVTWTKQPTSGVNVTTKNFRALFVSFPFIFVVGDSGAFFLSTNAGSSWASKNIPETYRTTNFHSIAFVSRSSLTLGWATGDNGVILGTANGGNLWLAETSNVTAALYGSYFAQAGDAEFQAGLGWVVGNNGTILKTHDFGTHWSSLISGSTANLRTVTFVDSLRGWACGEGGTILFTDDGGTSWKSQFSGTTSTLRSSFFLPLFQSAVQAYVLEVLGQRKYIFFDPATGSINFDYITKIDTGVLFFQPTDFGSSLNSGQFAVFINDSLRFNDHTNLGPSNPQIFNVSIAADTAGISRGQFQLLKWNLLASSEVRLVKIFQQQDTKTGLLITTGTLIDEVRFGGYRPSPDLFPNNEPAGFIPEWWSLARYSDDYGENPATASTNRSFYMSSDPIPGWYSQQHKPH